MHATIRRYEGVDTARTEELTRKVSETLVPQLQKLEGFGGYDARPDAHGAYHQFVRSVTFRCAT